MANDDKKVVRKFIEKIAIKVAAIDANTTCPCITYQPKLPSVVKDLRKNTGK